MSAPDPLSWLLLEAIAARLARVRLVNGYFTDVGAAVEIDLPSGGDLSGPELCVYAGIFQRGADKAQSKVTRNSKAEIVIELALPATTAGAMRDAHRARADLLRALQHTAVGLPPGAGAIDVTSEEILPRAAGVPAIVVRINASSGLTETIPTP